MDEEIKHLSSSHRCTLVEFGSIVPHWSTFFLACVEWVMVLNVVFALAYYKNWVYLIN